MIFFNLNFDGIGILLALVVGIICGGMVFKVME